MVFNHSFISSARKLNIESFSLQQKLLKLHSLTCKILIKEALSKRSFLFNKFNVIQSLYFLVVSPLNSFQARSIYVQANDAFAYFVLY